MGEAVQFLPWQWHVPFHVVISSYYKSSVWFEGLCTMFFLWLKPLCSEICVFRRNSVNWISRVGILFHCKFPKWFQGHYFLVIVCTENVAGNHASLGLLLLDARRASPDTQRSYLSISEMVCFWWTSRQCI